jgi:hypothetical protein
LTWNEERIKTKVNFVTFFEVLFAFFRDVH